MNFGDFFAAMLINQGITLVGLAGMTVLVLRILLNSKVLIKFIEGITVSFPPEVKSLFVQAGTLLTEIGDDIPIDQKPGYPVPPAPPAPEKTTGSITLSVSSEPSGSPEPAG